MDCDSPQSDRVLPYVVPIRGGCYAADLARGGRDVMRIAGHPLLEPQERIVNAMQSLTRDLVMDRVPNAT